MEIILYLEVNGMCIFVLSLLLVKLYINRNILQNNQFAYVIINALILCGLDCIWKQIDGDVSQSAVFHNKLVNALYLFWAGNLGYAWYRYSDSMLRHKKTPGIKKDILTGIPILFLFVLCISSIWTGWIYYVDDSNLYHRGSLYFFQPLIAYSYVFYSAGKALVYALKEKNHVRKIEYITLSSFIIMPVVMGAVQLVYTQIPTLCVGITLSLLIVFITLQDHQISLDPLTELNNRHHLHKYLMSHAHIGGIGHKNHLYLLMIDIDDFKKINDTYGHLEGDTALKSIAEALRKSCGFKNCFIARYGGDEFVVACECPNEQRVLEIEEAIRSAIRQENTKAKREYPLTVSIGYSVFDMTTENALQLVARADDQLYHEKLIRKRINKREEEAT